MRRVLVVALVVVCALAGASAAFGAESFGGPGNGEPGEIFVAQPGSDGSVQLSVDCNPAASSTVRFTASGSAYGNEFGTFSESGSFTIGPQTTVNGPAGPNTGAVQSLAASFSTDAGGVSATGSKQLDPQLSGNGNCRPVSDAPAGCSGIVAVDATIPFTYSASFSTGDRERGSGLLRVSLTQLDCGGSAVVLGQFEQDFIDVQPSEPTTLVLDPAAAVNPVDLPHTVTATVEDATHAPVAGATVLFATSGAVVSSATCVSDANGQCSVTFPGARLPGLETITAYVDNNQNGAPDAGEPTAVATKTYVLPASTPGSAEGAGKVGRVTFAVAVKSDGRGVEGGCLVRDDTARVRVRCLDVQAYIQQGNHATLFGRAEVNGADATFRIDLTDNGNPGRGRDVFQIQTSTGYATGGLLTEGNIAIHHR
jgi:hypothetical protein